MPDTATENQNVFLFDIKNDPYETNDLSASMPNKVQEMLERMAFYQTTAVPTEFDAETTDCNPALHGDAWIPWVHPH